jgi:hypothetical protein
LHDDVRIDDGKLAEARTALLLAAGEPLDEIRTGTPPPVEVKPIVGTGRRWAYALAGAAAVLVLVITGFLVTASSPGGTAAAAADLNAAADRVSASDPAIPAGKYQYRVTHSWSQGMIGLRTGKTLSFLQETVTETWMPADRTQEWMQRSTAGRRKWIVGSDKEAGRAIQKDSKPEVLRGRCGSFYPPAGQDPCGEEGGWSTPTPDWIAGLPKDPKALYERLRKDSPVNDRGDTELLVYAADALRTGLLPAKVRAELYRALGYLGNLEVMDRAANLEGKVGIAYGSDDGQVRQEIIVDPHNGEFIGEREVITSGKDRGQVVSFSSVTSAIVDKPLATPGR